MNDAETTVRETAIWFALFGGLVFAFLIGWLIFSDKDIRDEELPQKD